jgi:hypothetical protein
LGISESFHQKENGTKPGTVHSDLASFDADLPDATPPEASTQLTLLSLDGPLRAIASSEDFAYDRVPGGLVFRAAHDVIAQLRDLNP